MRRAARIDDNQPAIVAAKACGCCGVLKSASEFYADKSRPTGLRSQCIACHREGMARSREKHRESVLSKGRAYREENREWLRDRAAKGRHEARDALLARMGGKCVRCGFSDERALQFDHVHGDGMKERRSSTFDWWSRLKLMSNYTDAELHDRYQLLCANCNQIKKIERAEYGDGKKSRRESARNCRCLAGDRSNCTVHA